MSSTSSVVAPLAEAKGHCLAGVAPNWCRLSPPPLVVRVSRRAVPLWEGEAPAEPAPFGRARLLPSRPPLGARGSCRAVPPLGSASLPPSRSTLGGRGSRRAAGFNRHASSSAQQELRPPAGPRLPPNRGSERPCKQFGSAGASPSRRAQHPSQCHLHLHTGFRVDPFFRALRLCHATASAADCNHASRES